MRLIDVVLGDTFRPTWISSGATASPIQYRILTGSETIVSTYAGVDSGNGHYYADARIEPNSWGSGIYQARWYATVDANTHISPEWLNVFPEETNQPGRYITWDDVVHRYTDFSDFGGAVKAASHYIAAAEARIDGLLGSHFSIPFSNNNVTVRELSIDAAFMHAARGLSKEEYARINDRIMDTVTMLKAGDMVMVIGSGQIHRSDISRAWSSNQDYHPVFGMHDPLDWVVSSQQIIDEAAARGWN
jgi:hypothetical protein